MEKKEKRKLLKAIREIPKEKLDDLRMNVEAQSRMKVITMIMEEEGWTYEQTLDACLGENKDPRYSLYYKMSDPGVVLNLKSKKGKEKFAATLDDAEREIFLAEQDKIHVRKEMGKAVKRIITGKGS